MQDIVVQIQVASICGSDMHPYAGRGVRLDDGIIFGHEFVGIVCAVGDQVTNQAHARAADCLVLRRPNC